MSERIGIRVYGLPIPQGSKRIARRGKGKAQRTFLLDNNEATLHPWRAKVTAEATAQYLGLPTITNPVKVWVRFTFERPPSHYRAGRNAHLLRDGAPPAPTGRDLGDVDKLIRAVFDALTVAKVWADDSLVVDVRARKVYAGEDELALERAGVDIVIEPLDAYALVGGRGALQEALL